MFPEEVINQFKVHAKAEYPKEACGLIVGESAINCKYIPVTNIAETPTEDFRVKPEDYVLAAEHGEVLALMHTHVNKKDYPSGLDMENQMKSGMPWGIAVVSVDEANPDSEPVCSEPFFFGDQVPAPDLLGRPFRHGVWDCYSLVRDHFRLKGIIIPDKPRDFEWWDKGQNLYLDYFKDTGFVMIDPSDVREDDCVLMSIRSTVPNHGGIYLGDGILLHHLQWRLSRREPIHPWARKISHWLRYEGPSA